MRIMNIKRRNHTLTACLLLILCWVVQPAAAERLYVTGMSSDNVAGFTVGANGALSPIAGSPFPGGDSPFNVLHSPDGKFLYVSSFGTDTVSAFAVGADGSLTAVAGSPYTVAESDGLLEGVGIAISPNGKYLYAGLAGKVYAYGVAANGSLQPVSGSPFATGFALVLGPTWPVVSPDGNYLYATASGNIRAFKINANGSLNKTGIPLFGPFTSLYPRVTPDGKHIYVANELSGTVSAYNVSRGLILPAFGSPFKAGSIAHGTLISPDGRFLFVPNLLSENISVFSIKSNGRLVEIDHSPFPVGEGVGAVAISADGSRIYVATADVIDVTDTGVSISLEVESEIFTYSVGSDGSLTLIAGPYPSGVIFSDGPAITAIP